MEYSNLYADTRMLIQKLPLIIWAFKFFNYEG
jgi:hypothetical protein